MEELSYLPPRNQAPAIDYRTAVGNRSQSTECGVHYQKVTARIHQRCSRWSCRFIVFRLIDHPDARCLHDQDLRPAEVRRLPLARRPVCFNSAIGSTLGPGPLFALILQFSLPSRLFLNSTFHFVTTLERDNAPSGISGASSNAPIPKGIKVHLSTNPL